MVLDEKVILTSPITPTPSSNGVDNPLPSSAADDSGKTPRLPRWSRQEILVLIQGKKVAESRVRRGRAAGMGLSPLQLEPKWASVSSYCVKHGVNRGPVQCRKRWSNLVGDFKKIKDWESQLRDESDSFWLMRNDLRRERKLPGFFDREVYDILDGATHVVSSSFSTATSSAVIAQPVPGLSLALAPAADGEADAVFDSGRSAVAEDGLFSDFEQEEATAAAAISHEKEVSPRKEPSPKTTPVGIAAPIPISEKHYQPPPFQAPQTQGGGTSTEKQPASNPETSSASQEGRKRKRFAGEEEEEEEEDDDDDNNNGTAADIQNQLIGILERNGRMVAAQLEAQNTNFQLDREQRKDHADSLVGVLNKLADALGKIADKL